MEFRNVQYIPVNNTNTSLVNVFIRSDMVEKIPFTSGKAVLTVHIRPVIRD